MALPTYYRNKLYNEEEREKLWLEKLDKQERWVDGSRISIAGGDQKYYALLKQARAKNKRLGYGDDQKNWDQHNYENERRNLLHRQRTGTDRQDNNALGTEKLDRRREMEPNQQAERARLWIRKMLNRTNTE